jgi:hypothetical protein
VLWLLDRAAKLTTDLSEPVHMQKLSDGGRSPPAPARLFVSGSSHELFIPSLLPEGFKVGTDVPK